MNGVIRRAGMIAGLSALSLASAGVLAPGAYADNTIDGNVKVSNTETVQVAMDASGKIDAQRIYEQLVLAGRGKVDIANPVSTKGLRNLDGFGGFNVHDGTVRVKTDVDGSKKYRSVSDFTKKLPLAVKITYTLDGKAMKPSGIVGKSGTLQVRYQVKNVTGVQQDVTYADGKGRQQSSPENVVVPMVATLATTLPSTFSKVVAPKANGGGDGRGGTQLQFTMTLIPPIGSASADVSYTAEVKDAVIPRADISATPVNPLTDISFKGGSESYQGGAQTGADLTAGAVEIDDNLLKLASGAADLVNGIVQLSDGADQLSAGLNGDAAPGARKLADGGKQLDDGAGQLADGTSDLSAGAKKLDGGAGDLSAGLKTASAGGPALLEGVAKLRAGAKSVDDGLVALQGAVGAGVGAPGTDNTLRNGVAQLLGALGASGPLQGGLASVTGALTSAQGLVDSLPDSPQKTGLQQYLAGAKSGVAQVVGGINQQVLPGLNGLDTGLQTLNGKVAGGVGSPAAAGTLRNGMAQLIGGLDQLSGQGR